MQDLQVFNHDQFGTVRTIEEKGKVLFCGTDAATALGYTNPQKAIRDHCKNDGVTIRSVIDNLGRKQKAKFISEGNLYRLITGSQLPTAEKFESWIFDEVLPSIRRTGEYAAPKKARQRLGEINSAARIIRQTLKEAGMAPQFVAVALKSLYAPAGVEIPLDGITLNKKLYDATAIAEKLGVFSKSGCPHAQAVSAILAQADVSEEEKELAPFQSQASGHSGTNWQYTESAVSKARLWLERYGYPAEISYKGKTFKVHYQNKIA